MKTLDELRAFAEGYLAAMKAEGGLIEHADDWFAWGGYDINFAGSYYTDSVQDTGLRVDAYKAGWTDDIGDPIHTFITYGESK